MDSVNFSRASWVARNVIEVGGQPRWNTIPIQQASQNTPISDLEIDFAQPWREKTLKTLRHSFKKNSTNTPVFQMVEEWFEFPEAKLSSFLTNTIEHTLRNIGFSTKIYPSDTSFQKDKIERSGQEKIIGICRELDANTYLNLPSGSGLYDAPSFTDSGVELCFLPRLRPETDDDRFPYRSVLSHLMEVGFAGVGERIEEILFHSKSNGESFG